jgi:hypothetical protein
VGFSRARSGKAISENLIYILNSHQKINYQEVQNFCYLLFPLFDVLNFRLPRSFFSACDDEDYQAAADKEEFCEAAAKNSISPLILCDSF